MKAQLAQPSVAAPKFKEGDAVKWEQKGELRTGFVGKPKLVEGYDGIERYQYPVGVGNKFLADISEEDLAFAPEGTKTKAPIAAPAEEIPTRKMRPLEYMSYGKERNVRSYQEYKGYKITHPHKGLYEILDQKNNVVGQYAGPNGAIGAIDEGVIDRKLGIQPPVAAPRSNPERNAGSTPAQSIMITT